MRGTVAKRIRRAVYGDQSLRGRTLEREPSGRFVADNVRQAYQWRKRQWMRRNITRRRHDV